MKCHFASKKNRCPGDPSGKKPKEIGKARIARNHYSIEASL
jgi:hypothetical protein